ncbi:DUF418 domain-containing protein [Aurantibacter crassamenti]|uniref:DUF418 domain-containing protein n=1 Tax=Aurantibacter crassamenti TaxID=1837375 RepID=UPI00193A5C38|nr:DUF418 domain-containing protein [Aurantibacter crassamenti]MBM1107072.1 DUF418 domain-containing protein [Aurantibacter crassamenti]
MSTLKTPRITIIDSLRGLALAGILICHMVENYFGSIQPTEFTTAVNSSAIDSIIDGAVSFFLRGKFIALFSFLFGLSFFIQMDNGAKKGGNYGIRFLWRLVILLGIGYVHSLFYRGDILTIYAFLGIFLIPFYKIQNKWILGLAALLFLGLGRYVIFAITGGDRIFGGPFIIDPGAAWVLEYYEVIKNGSLLDVFEANSISGHINKIEYQFGFFGRGYYTFAFFLIGLYTGRSEFFKNFNERKKLTKKVLIWASVILLISFGLVAFIFSMLGENVQFNTWLSMLGLTAFEISNMAMTFIWIALFVMLYRKIKGEKILENLAPYGRMALTNYVLQSIIGTFLLYGWGLGYLGKLTNLYTFLIALVLIGIQVWGSKIWLRYFYYGPLEWLWRCLTFFKVFPMKK